MSEPKEDIDLLSQKELEDGEIEEGELDEPEFISTVDNDSGLINTDIHDDSDVNINDKSTLKFKKHKHHKKGLHRKRHINSEDKFDNRWKKSKKSNDEDDDEEGSPELTDCKINLVDNESEIPSTEKLQKSYTTDHEVSDNVKSSLKWGSYDSEEESIGSKNFNNNDKADTNQSSFSDSQTKIKHIEIILSPEYEPVSCDVDIPVNKEVCEVSKWNDYDSEDETNVSSSFKNSDTKRNSFDESHGSSFKSFKRWDSNYNKNNDNRGWGERLPSNNENRKDNNYYQSNNDYDTSNSPVKAQDFPISDSKLSSPTYEKTSWYSYESPKPQNEDIAKNSDLNNSPQKSSIDNFGKWGSYDSPDRIQDDSTKWDSRDSPKVNEDTQKWGSRDSPKRNDDYNKWNNRDSPKQNDDSHKWNSRDGSRRNNYRRWGGRDGSRRNNFRRWGGRDGSQRHNDNQRWGSSNNGSPQRCNDDNKRWDSFSNNSPQRNNDNNKKYGSSYSGSPQGNNDKRWGSSNNNSPQRNNDGMRRWSTSNNESPQRGNDDKQWGLSNDGSPKADDKINQEMQDLPQTSKWGSYDSDEENVKTTEDNNNNSETKVDESNKWDLQDSPKGNDNSGGSAFGKWGAFDSDEEGKPTVKENTSHGNNAGRSNKTNWKSQDNDNDSKGTFNENRNKGGYNNNWNRNDRNERNDFRNDWNERGDFKNDRSKRWSNRNDNEKRSVCKYYSMGSCHHGDRCTYLHESPTKTVSQEIKKKELCKFYEHQQCYKRTNCIYMHEEFPCKLFHAGSKMCPSGDSCKYSHAPLNQETKLLLEKYLDEKVDERTDKNGSEWSSIIKKSAEDDDNDDDNATGFEQPEGFFPDQLRYRYPGGQDIMRFPVRPWNTMMRYNDMSMQVPHQMEFMHRQRFMCQYPMNAGRMFPRGFRGMVTPNMHEGFSNGMPYTIPPLIQPNSKLHPGNAAELKDNFNISDPYIDNLAQLVVSKDSSSSPKRLVDMLDPNIQCEDADDFPLEVEINSSKKNLSSPVVIKSPEIPPGAYVPRTSMNVAQPNVRLGPGPAYGSEQAMLYGGYPAHPGESAMMDYINMSAIHYFHNHTEAMGYDIPWKLVPLEVPIKIPYPLMVIETQDLMHKYTDPRLKGHPSVLNSNNASEESMMHQNSYDYNSISSTFGSQLSSPNFITASSESSETHTPLNDFLPKSDEPESPMFPISDEIFSFKHKMETDDYSKKVSDRSYLQDPRFKRKKVIVNAAMDSSEME